MVIRGKSITYGITLLKDAPHKKEAIIFLEYLLSSKKGLRVLKEMSQPPFVPARVSTVRIKEILPGEIRKLVEVKD